MAALVDAYVARKLLGALSRWLSTDAPSYIEVLEWYRGWKQLIGVNLVASPSLETLFTRAADMINRAALIALGKACPPRKRRRGPPDVVVEGEDDRGSRASAPKRAKAGLSASSRVPGDLGSVRDLVQRMADERGLTFMPKADRTTKDGSQLCVILPLIAARNDCLPACR